MTSPIDQDLYWIQQGYHLLQHWHYQDQGGSSTNSDAVWSTSSTTLFTGVGVPVPWSEHRSECDDVACRISVVHITITMWYQHRIYNFVDQCQCIGVGVRIRSSRITIIVTTIRTTSINTSTSTSRSTKKIWSNGRSFCNYKISSRTTLICLFFFLPTTFSLSSASIT